MTLPDEELIELKRVENFLPHEEAEAQALSGRLTPPTT
jgi:hypothetical protein